MRKIPSLPIIMICLLASIVTHLSARELKQVDITFDLDEFQIIPDGDNTYAIETMEPGYYYPEDPSLPAIPMKTIRVLVPNGAEFMGCQIEAEEGIVKENIILSKAPVPVPTNSLDLIEHAECDYKGVYPENPVEYKTTMIQRGYTWFSFRISPFRYDGYKKELTFVRSIKLNVEYKISEEKSSIIKRDEDLVQSLKKSVANPDDLDRFYPPSNIAVPKSAMDRVDYLVVTSEEFKQELKPLLEWKTRKGLSVEMLTMDEIEEKYTDATIQLKIKRCLKEYYTNNDLQWVLLAGDHDIVPVQGCYSEINLRFVGSSAESIPTDLFYACFDKEFDWNSMQDEKVGQIYFDYVDLVPEINISRIPVRTREQAATFVNKTLNYETGHPPVEYYGRILNAGVKLWNFWDGKSDSHHRSERIYSKFMAGNFKGEKIGFYDSGTDYPEGEAYQLSSSNLADELNKGYGIFHFSGHGNKTSLHMESGTDFNVDDASELKNPVAGIILSNSCGVSAFDLGDPCLAEAFLRNPEGGCVAFFGSSRFGFSNTEQSCKLGPSLNFNASFLRHLFVDEMDSVWNSFATIASLSKTNFAEHGIAGGTYLYLLYSINALGDPEMPIYTSNPYRFESVGIERHGNSITVNTGGVSKCRICITSLDLGMGYQQVRKGVSCHTFHDVPDSCQVTITAPNYIPYRYISGLCTGMEKDINLSIRVYPNPTSGLITVHVPGLETYSINITSVNGHLLLSRDSADSELQLDLSNFQTGIYCISVRSRNYVRTEKIIKL